MTWSQSLLSCSAWPHPNNARKASARSGVKRSLFRSKVIPLRLNIPLAASTAAFFSSGHGQRPCSEIVVSLVPCQRLSKTSWPFCQKFPRSPIGHVNSFRLPRATPTAPGRSRIPSNSSPRAAGEPFQFRIPRGLDVAQPEANHPANLVMGQMPFLTPVVNCPKRDLEMCCKLAFRQNRVIL